MDHKCDGSAIPEYEKYCKTKQVTKRQKFMIIGWHFLVKRKYGSESWVQLKGLK